MKIDFGQAISIFANIGVIAGIAFLGYELRQNNELMSAEANLQLLDNRLSSFDRVNSDDVLASAYLKRAGGESLTPIEELKLQNWNMTNWMKWEWEYRRYLDGYISITELPVEGWRASIISTPGFLDVWTDQRDVLDPSPEFESFIEEELRRH